MPYMEQDVLLAVSYFLSLFSFATMSEPDIRRIWPLGPSEAEDLAWMSVGVGGNVVCQMTDLTKRQSCFTPVREQLIHFMPPPNGSAPICVSMLPPLLCRLFLDDLEASTCDTNPYHAVLSVLSQLNQRQLKHDSFYDVFSLLHYIQPEYRSLLEAKDLRALLLLAYWFAKIASANIWWAKRRCILQGFSVCDYIESSSLADSEMKKLLRYPRKVLRDACLS